MLQEKQDKLVAVLAVQLLPIIRFDQIYQCVWIIVFQACRSLNTAASKTSLQI